MATRRSSSRHTQVQEPQRDSRLDTQDLQAEGHRQRASWLDSCRAASWWRHSSWPDPSLARSWYAPMASRIGSMCSFVCRGRRAHDIGEPRADLPKKVRKLGLCSTLSAKLAEGNLIVMDDADIASHKTKELVQTLSSSGWNDSMLIFVGAPKRNLDLATRNLGHVTLAAVQRINVYEILRRRYLFLAKDSLPFIHERLLEDAYDLGIDDDDVAALSSATE